MSPTGSADIGPRYVLAAEKLRSNAGQWAAYESTGDCVVLAGPGSGKTKTLTIKLARMLAEDVREPRGIACITYSNECARELVRKLDLLGVVESKRVYIGTMHSFCLKNVVLPFARLGGIALPDDVEIADESKQDEAFDAALNQLALSKDKFELRTRMVWYRRTYLDRGTKQWKSDPVTAALVEAYEENLHKQGLIDFDDMSLMGVRLVESFPWVRQALKARFPILSIDEYQDLGVPLHRLVLGLRSAGVRIFAVGDPNQSIYGFTGADPKLLMNLATLDSRVEPVQLKLNYRCGGTIVKASQITLQRDMGYEAVGGHEGTIEIHPCQTGTEDQAKYLCESIIPDVLQRRPRLKLGDIAVLYMDRNDGDIIADEVQAHGWRFVRTDKGAPYPKTPLTRWLEECAAWCSRGWRSGTPRLSSIISTLYSLASFKGESSDRDDYRRRLVKFLWNSRSGDLTLLGWLKALHETLLDGLLRDHLARPDRLDYEKLVFACSPNGTLSHFTVAHFGGQRGASDHLNLITLHSSKGLEFDVVILVGMEYGKLPKFNPDADSRSEARRLFYVGLTRARHEVHITYAARRWSKRTQRYYPTEPSEFVQELWDK